MKKLLMVLGLGLLLVGCNNGEVESLKKELEEVRAENLEMKVLLAADTGTYTEADIERIAANGENSQAKAWKDGESDYDKVRDSVMSGSDGLIPQDLDVETYSKNLTWEIGDAGEGADPMGHHYYTRFAETGNKVYIELDTDMKINGQVAYTVVPSDTTLNGSKVLLILERK